MQTKEEIKESWIEAAKFMGKAVFNEYRAIPNEEKAVYFSKMLDPTKSYFVKGSSEKIRNFELCYIFNLTGKNKQPLYNKQPYSLREYVLNASSIVQDSEENCDPFDQEVLILYIHNQLSGVGNIENWMFSSALAAIADRNRYKHRTLILSERSVPELERSGEFEVINLGGARGIKKPKEVIDNINKKNNEQAQNNFDEDENNNFVKANPKY